MKKQSVELAEEGEADEPNDQSKAQKIVWEIQRQDREEQRNESDQKRARQIKQHKLNTQTIQVPYAHVRP